MNKERIVEVANKTRRRELDKRTRTIAEEALDILKIKTPRWIFSAGFLRFNQFN